MAKDKKKDKAENAKADAKAEKAAEREFQYGVEDLAKELDIKPASVRVQLRNKGIEKAGKSYGWNSKKDLQAVIDQLKADNGKAEKKADKKSSKKGDDDEGAGKKSKKNKKSKD